MSLPSSLRTFVFDDDGSELPGAGHDGLFGGEPLDARGTEKAGNPGRSRQHFLCILGTGYRTAVTEHDDIGPNGGSGVTHFLNAPEL
jgi:hypothetical protein